MGPGRGKAAPDCEETRGIVLAATRGARVRPALPETIQIFSRSNPEDFPHPLLLSWRHRVEATLAAGGCFTPFERTAMSPSTCLDARQLEPSLTKGSTLSVPEEVPMTFDPKHFFLPGLSTLFGEADLSNLADPLSTPLSGGEDISGGEDENAYSLAVQAYVYGFPWIYLTQLQWMCTTRAGAKVVKANSKSTQGFPVPINQFWRSEDLASPSNSSGGSPNVDTLYAIAWCDLSRGPLVLSVPEVDDRYYCVEMSAIDSDTYGYVGSRSTGTAAANYLIAGPGWDGEIRQDPDNPVLDVLPRAIYPSIFLLARTGVNAHTTEEVEAALRVQAKYRLTPLAKWEGREDQARTPRAQTPVGFEYDNTEGAWVTMNRAMTENPPGVAPGIPQDQLLQLFAQIGVGP